MKLYLISQDENEDYDTYDSAVVAAPSAGYAKLMHPANGSVDWWPERFGTWATDSDTVEVKYLGEAAKSIKKPCVICSSFNAG